MKIVYLIRHGETYHNSDKNRLSGVTDIGMTEKGINQCRELSIFFLDKEIKEVYASPLSRSIDSAKYIFPTFRNSIKISKYLIEINYGDYEGVDKGEVISEDEVIKKWEAAPGDLTFPNGDNVREHANYAYKGFKEIVENSQHDILACVSHRTSIRLLVAKILNVDLDSFRDIPCFNCSVTKFEYGGEGLKLVTLNAGLDFTNSKQYRKGR